MVDDKEKFTEAKKHLELLLRELMCIKFHSKRNELMHIAIVKKTEDMLRLIEVYASSPSTKRSELIACLGAKLKVNHALNELCEKLLCKELKDIKILL